MTLDARSNRLIMTNLHNARDLGGLPTASGQNTCFKRFVRSDEPTLLTPEEIDQLLAYPIRTVIDLRSAGELERRPNVLIDHPEILYLNISFFESDPEIHDDVSVQIAIEHTLGEMYINLLENRQVQLLEIFKAILDAPPGAIVFHCTHGKDRTGIVAALLLSLAGVSREDIIDNYAVTYEYIKPIVDAKIKTLHPRMHHLFKSDPDNMVLLLDYLDHNFAGEAADYLSSIGLTQGEIQQLRSRLLD